MRIKRPARGWPWEQPNFPGFWNGWPVGYVPKCADQQRRNPQSLPRDGPNRRLGGTAHMRGDMPDWLAAKKG